MTALIALLALSTYAPAVSSPDADALSTLALNAEPVALTAAPADDMKKGFASYTYIEANYIWSDIDGLDDPLDGWEARVSFELPLNIFLQASYGEISDDFDLTQWRVGAGWHLPIGQKFDAYGILSVAGEEIDDFDESEDGLAAEVGGRFLLGEKIELNARINWVDVDDSNTGAGVGGRFYFNPKFSAGLNADYDDERATYTAGLRFQF